MIHTYRKTALIEAEQFDGTPEIIKKYNVVILGTLTTDGRVIDGCLVL